MESIIGSKEVSKAAIGLAITGDREEEKEYVRKAAEQGIKCAAADFGGEFIPSVTKIIERAVTAAQKTGLIENSHSEEGAVAGAAREALSQVMNKAIGLNVGGKITVARYGEHICVALFFGIGLLNLNEIAVGLGHRVV